jgi:hypothetical protein
MGDALDARNVAFAHPQLSVHRFIVRLGRERRGRHAEQFIAAQVLCAPCSRPVGRRTPRYGHLAPALVGDSSEGTLAVAIRSLFGNIKMSFITLYP